MLSVILCLAKMISSNQDLSSESVWAMHLHSRLRICRHRRAATCILWPCVSCIFLVVWPSIHGGQQNLLQRGGQAQCNTGIHDYQLSSGQEEPSRCKIRQNWDFLRYHLFCTSQSVSRTTFDKFATKNVVKCCLNFLISILILIFKYTFDDISI